MNIREMKISDYENIYKLWESDPGIGISSADKKENLEFYLKKIRI